MTKVGVAIVGAGAISETHATAIRNSSSVRLAAVCDVDLTRAKALAQASGAASAYSDLEDVLRDKSVEGVVIATPNNHHASQVIACARAHRAVLCEKPFGNSIKEAHAAAAACADANVVLRVGFNQRFLRQVQMAKLAIERNVIGEIYAFRSVFSGKWDNHADEKNYRFDLKRSGGATINDNLIHRFDLIRYLLQDEFASVVADLVHSVIPPIVDDNVHLIVTTRNGARGTLSADRFSPAPADSTDIYGTRGSIHFVTNVVSPFHAVPLAIFSMAPSADIPAELLGATFPLARARRNPAWSGWMTFWQGSDSGYDTQMEEFGRAIRGEATRSIAATGHDGIRATELVQASYASQLDRAWVELPLPEDTPFRIPDYA